MASVTANDKVIGERYIVEVKNISKNILEQLVSSSAPLDGSSTYGNSLDMKQLPNTLIFDMYPNDVYPYINVIDENGKTVHIYCEDRDEFMVFVFEYFKGIGKLEGPLYDMYS